MSCDCNTLVVGEAGVQGPQGLAGSNGTNGTNGINAFTTVAANFPQPAVNDPITFSVVENRWIAVGQTIYISGAGFYTVTVVGGTPYTSVTATLVRAAGVNPSGSVTAGLKVSPSAGATYSDPLSSLTVNGSSILNGPTVVNESGAAVDFRVESDTETHLLYTKGSTNRIGVKTSSPAADLDISGTFRVAGLSEFRLGATINSSQVNNSDFVVMTDNFTNTLVVSASSDRVGIGISDPKKLLDVNGAAQAVSFLVNPGGVSGASTFLVRGVSSSDLLNVNANTNRVGIKTATPAVELDVVGATNISGDLSVDTNVLKVDTSNNFVGINKTPTVALDVSGSTILGSLLVSGAATLSSTLNVVGATTMNSTLAVSNNLNIDSGVLFVDTSSNRVGVNTTAPTSSLTVSGSANITGELNSTSVLYVKNTGYVGINNTTPAVPLDVTGDAAISGNASISGNLTVDTSTLVVNSTNNRVGIRKASPDFELDVTGAVQATSYQIETSAAKITKLYRGSVSLESTDSLGSLTGAGTYQTYTHYLPNVLSGDFAQVTYSSSENNFADKVMISAYCVSNYVKIVFFNMSSTDFSATTTNITINIFVTRAAAS
jgi:hypothetical protein